MAFTFAQGLADVMLSCPPKAKPIVAACTEALGEKPKWLGRVVGKCLKLHSHEWHDGARDRLADSLASMRAVYTTSLRMRRYCLQPAQPPPAFQELNLPALANPSDLASWLGITLDQLEVFTHPRQYSRTHPRCWHYYQELRHKRDGGQRLLEIPKARLKALQRKILKGILEPVPVHEAAHGFRPGRGPRSGAQLHLGQPVVLNCDLADFFLSISANRVVGFFLFLGYTRAVASRLASLCTTRLPRAGHVPNLDFNLKQRYRVPHLPQGAPTSPALANLCAFRLDLRVNGLARRLGATYTRYADDLTLSGSNLAWLPVQLDAIAQEEGFRLNHRKTSVMRASQRQEVTSIVVNQKINGRRHDYDLLKAILHNCLRHGPHSQNRSAHLDYQSHLRGKIAHQAHLNPHRGEKLLLMFQQISW